MIGIIVLITLHLCSQIETKEVIYPRYGKFTNDVPFDNSAGYLPQSPEYIKTRFILFSSRNVNTIYSVPACSDFSAIGSHFVREWPLKIIIHGYQSHGLAPRLVAMKNELLKRAQFNVIMVDWQFGCKMFYGQAAANTRLVGAQVAQLVNYLHRNYQLKMSSVHIIGHSLGAHVAGYAGYRLLYELSVVRRITGLDPARPYFEYKNNLVKLDRNDAQFVDIIHTDSSTDYLSTGFGTGEATGTVDFYVNGGERQPGCPRGISQNFRITSPKDTIKSLSCSHSRAQELFTESINSMCPFYSFPCQSKNDFYNGKCTLCVQNVCPKMGYKSIETWPKGQYFLDTFGSPPFCAIRHLFMTIQLNPSSTPNFGHILVTIMCMAKAVPITVPNAFKPGQDFLVSVVGVTRTTNECVDRVSVQYITPPVKGVNAPRIFIQQITVQFFGSAFRFIFDTKNALVRPGSPMLFTSGMIRSI